MVIARNTGASRSTIAQAQKRGDVRINGETAKGSTVVEIGDALEYRLLGRPEHVPQPEAIDVPVVYEDDDVIVVDKPAGMTTHPAHGAIGGTLVNAMLAHCGVLPGEALRPGLVHRLDRDTSGLLVVAKNIAAMRALSKAMKARKISREYLGLVQGIPAFPRGKVDGALGRDPNHRLKRAIVSDGKPAVTHYELVEKLHDASELRFTLETGRTHQIRVHMAAMGHPVVNDPLYGKRDGRFPLPGQALHAWRLRFRHPVTGDEMQFEAPPPREYAVTKELLRR